MRNGHAYDLADDIIESICQAEVKNGEMESFDVLSTLSFVDAGKRSCRRRAASPP
jgi:hypothetical protein